MSESVLWQRWCSDVVAPRLFDGFYNDFERDCLDSAIQLDHNLVYCLQQFGAVEVGRRIEQMLDVCTDEEATRRHLMPMFHSSGLPDGRAVKDWALRMADRFSEISGFPNSVPQPVDDNRTGFDAPRLGRWLSLGARDDTVKAALRALEQHMQEWMAEPEGHSWERHHVVLDLESQVGSVAPLSLLPPCASEANHSVSTSTIAMTLVRTAEPGQGRVEVLWARPELPLDDAVRRQFPDLCHFYGGYFGQRFDDSTGFPMNAMREAMRLTCGAARDRLREQLSDLLRLPHSDINYVVEQCGSFALPRHMRYWVERTLWRLDAYDWGAELPKIMAPPTSPED